MFERFTQELLQADAINAALSGNLTWLRALMGVEACYKADITEPANEKRLANQKRFDELNQKGTQALTSEEQTEFQKLQGEITRFKVEIKSKLAEDFYSMLLEQSQNPLFTHYGEITEGNVEQFLNQVKLDSADIYDMYNQSLIYLVVLNGSKETNQASYLAIAKLLLVNGANSLHKSASGVASASDVAVNAKGAWLELFKNYQVTHAADDLLEWEKSLLTVIEGICDTYISELTYMNSWLYSDDHRDLDSYIKALLQHIKTARETTKNINGLRDYITNTIKPRMATITDIKFSALQRFIGTIVSQFTSIMATITQQQEKEAAQSFQPRQLALIDRKLDTLQRVIAGNEQHGFAAPLPQMGLVSQVQELNVLVKALQDQNLELQGKNKELQTRLDGIETNQAKNAAAMEAQLEALRELVQARENVVDLLKAKGVVPQPQQDAAAAPKFS